MVAFYNSTVSTEQVFDSSIQSFIPCVLIDYYILDMV